MKRLPKPMRRQRTLVASVLDHAKGPRQFAHGYLRYLSGLLRRLDVRAVAGWIDVLEAARRGRHTVFVAGNGGSAATAAHMATDLGGRGRADDGALTIRAVALTENPALLTALANDHGYGEVFVSQLRLRYRPGDVLVVLSASGDSENLVLAASWVHSQGGKVLGLLGFDGGKLLELCDVAVHVKTRPGAYGPVEDAHLAIHHIVTACLRPRASVVGRPE